MIDPKAIDAVLAIFVPLIQAHRQTSPKPFVLGLSGLQGSGKSTWAAALSVSLAGQHGLKTRILSLDDLYSDHAELVALREANPDNGLLQTRGQPGTHDEALAQDFFSKINEINSAKAKDSFISWPAYDKSLNGGQGGRVPIAQWEKVPVSDGLDVLIFEGWCLGFQPLTDDQVKEKWLEDKDATETAQPLSEESKLIQTLASHDLSHLQLINNNLGRYCESFTGPSYFDGFLHLGTDKLMHVYEWRLGQEEALRRHKPGMTDEQVVRFVRGYMPAYELFLDRLQHENFFKGDEGGDSPKKHVQVVLNQGREVVQVKAVE
ncbi:P-loop containing nucleoside triphosphate hydrolase protein [Thelonectria olida]|uniref:P-loop containing nucleoside triphosphate hydrolase protein n=1 Tax=Thelonectria olida TaxID=1576542 RepID=A0A9P8WLH9_9HYPO|nr:P-loop containing nucleoside triphosphate hydrolase protein [Thelonectria olida]